MVSAQSMRPGFVIAPSISDVAPGLFGMTKGPMRNSVTLSVVSFLTRLLNEQTRELASWLETGDR